MKPFQKIVVFLGAESLGTNSEGLRRAVELARQDHASLHLISVVEAFPRLARWLLRGVDDLVDLIANERLKRLEALAAPLREQGIDVTAAVLRGRPGQELVREVIGHAPDLLIKDTRTSGEPLLSSTDWHLLRDCPCAVLVVRRPQAGPGNPRILVAVDPAPIPRPIGPTSHDDDPEAEVKHALNVKIMAMAADLAERSQGELHVLHAWRVPGETMLRAETLVPAVEIDEYVEGMEAAARRGLDRLTGETAA